MMSHVHHREGLPSPFLIENIDLLPKGRALDVAMGRGRNAVYLAEQGFDVEGIDISPEAVEAALDQARKSGVFLNVRLEDLEKDIFIEKNIYDVIICFNYLHRPLIPMIKDALRPGGVLVYETYIVDQARFGRPRNPKHLLKHNELLDLFRDFRCLRYREGILENRKAMASFIGMKV